VLPRCTTTLHKHSLFTTGVAVLAVLRSKTKAFPLSTVIIEQYRPPLDNIVIGMLFPTVDNSFADYFILFRS
jgi:hypothetical protein